MADEGASPLTTISLATSGATLLFGVVRRLILCIMFTRRREARLTSRERSLAASEAAASQAGANLTEMARVLRETQMMPTRTFTTDAAPPSAERVSNAQAGADDDEKHEI